MKVILPCTTAWVCLLAIMVGAESLDGGKWKIKVTPDKETAAKGEKEFDDELIFADGKVTSTGCVPYGFNASPYKTQKKEKGTKWETDQVSEKEGKAHWSGKIKGDEIKGNMTWSKKDGATLHYTFAGKKE